VTTYTELYSAAESLGRVWFNSKTLGVATAYNGIAAPVGAKCAIISGVGAGGWLENSSVPGGGAAFAKTKLSDIQAGELFSVQVGTPTWTLGTGAVQGDTVVTRVTGNDVVCRAVRGSGIIVNTSLIVNGGAPGLDADCVGTIKRSGKHGNSISGVLIGGESGGDAEDIYSLGFGGRGARVGRFPAAGWGGGGIHRVVYDPAGSTSIFFAGAGRACIEWFTKDPGYI